jgi:hypothetical protein
MDAPVIGAQAKLYADPGTWQASVSMRYQKSDRHFIGSDEQEEREEEGSQVINTIFLLDYSLRYNWTARTSFTLSVPYFMGERSQTIRDENRVVIKRYMTQARGVGDIILTARSFLFDPAAETKGNVSFGFGFKLPTGEDNATDAFLVRNSDGTYKNEIRPVDQSIQPGDGGFGYLVEVQGFRRFLDGNLSAYASASYLFNPEATNGTRRSLTSDTENSVGDQYLATLGVAGAIPGVPGLSARLGGRLEGMPWDDAIGSSKGFRRPGHAVSIEPAVSYSWNDETVSLAMPWAVYRNRTRSYSDRQGTGHGDAAFADYIVFLGWTHRY